MRLASILILLLALNSQAAVNAQGKSRVLASPPLPNPVLVFMGAEYFQANGRSYTRYRFTVDNRADYPDELFAPAPELPPCGLNNRSSRSWVDLHDQTGKRLNGFCALGNREGLSQIWFALESEVVPPSWIYIKINDRKTNTTYQSNLAETTM